MSKEFHEYDVSDCCGHDYWEHEIDGGEACDNFIELECKRCRNLCSAIPLSEYNELEKQ